MVDEQLQTAPKQDAKREAILLIPGIAMDWCSEQVDTIGQKIAAALDRNAADVNARFSVSFTTRNYGQDSSPKLKTRVGTVTRARARAAPAVNGAVGAGATGESEPLPVLDLYGIGYDEALTNAYARHSLVIKLFLLLLAVVHFVPLLCKAMLPNWLQQRLRGRTSEERGERPGRTGSASFRARELERARVLNEYWRAKPAREKVQLLLATGVLVLLCVYGIILLIALWQVLQSLLFHVSGQQLAHDGSSWQVRLYDWWNTHWLTGWLAGISDFIRPVAWPIFSFAGGWFAFAGSNAKPAIVLLTALGALLPNRRNLQEAVSGAAVEFLCLNYYLSMGDRRNVLIGHVSALLEDICEQGQYERIHVLAYSFGSVVALDALFPILREPTTRFNKIDTLVTIGCPLDTIRLFWPQYFRERRKLRDVPKRWLNIYSRVDVLSSNFNNRDSEVTESDYVLGLERDWLDRVGPHRPECYQRMPAQCAARLKHALSVACADDPVCKEQRAQHIPTCEKQLAQQPLMCTAQCIRIKPENLLFSDAASAKQLGVMSQLTLLGMRAHSMYWEPANEQEVSCFDVLIPKLFEGRPILTDDPSSKRDARTHADTALNKRGKTVDENGSSPPPTAGKPPDEQRAAAPVS